MSKPYMPLNPDMVSEMFIFNLDFRKLFTLQSQAPLLSKFLFVKILKK